MNSYFGTFRYIYPLFPYMDIGDILSANLKLATFLDNSLRVNPRKFIEFLKKSFFIKYGNKFT